MQDADAERVLSARILDDDRPEALMGQLADEQHFIAIPPPEDVTGGLELSSANSVFVLFALCFGYPFLFLGTGILIRLRRRRRGHVTP